MERLVGRSYATQKGFKMEKDFAKLFNIDGAQVLIYYDFDTDADITTIHQITEVDGVRADMKIELDGPDQEERMTKYLSGLTDHHAKQFRAKMLEMMS